MIFLNRDYFVCQKKKKKTVKSFLPRSIKRLFPNVTSVVDSNKSVSVSVSNNDNVSGKKKAATMCAMAKAVCREFKADGAIIGMSYSYIIKDNKAIRYTTPNTVSREITGFDRGHTFEPGEYQLSPISPSQRMGSRSGSDKSKSTDHKPKRIVHKTAKVRNMVIKDGSDD